MSSSLAGGASDKIGNRYEARWTIYCMIDVMDEKADSITLEKVGEDAFEFCLRRNTGLEYHQVKRQKSGRGRWTIKGLEDTHVQVLSDFWHKLRNNPEVSCIFVSTQDADELNELAERARDAVSWTVFEQKFLNQTLSGHFDNLRKKWFNCSETEAYEALQHIFVETISEKLLVDAVENRLSALVEGDPKIIRIELVELALNRLHQELTSYDIWHYLLKERGYRRREWGKDPHVIAAVHKLNNRYIARLEKEAIAGNVIPRDEVDSIVDKLTSTDGKQRVLVTGEAGVGKSSVILQAVTKIRQTGTPLIAFRVDRLNPTDSPDKLGEQENLPGSPAHVLANIAQGRDCVLVIDQLDAVSMASGRNTQFFECVEQIIDQAQAFPGMRLLLACRKFDLDNDYRIKRLTGENRIADTVTISRLSHDKVREVVAGLGLDIRHLNNKQLELLSLPLHLRLLTEVAEGSHVNILSFNTVRDLYDRFWDYKRDVIEKEHLGRPVEWTQVIDALCDEMSNRQTLSAKEGVVDTWRSDAKAMVSEHVLVKEDKRYSFFHEGFFDYAFARRFDDRNLELLPFLLSSEQHLFRRAQVRQILLHQREADFEIYLENLRELLTHSQIRFHIKQVVFALLAALDAPKEEEWEIIASLIGENADPITQHVWYTLFSSFPWFQLLDDLGIIEQWLRDEDRVEQAVNLLRVRQKQIPDRVAELLEPFVGMSEVWNERLSNLVKRSQVSAGERFFRFFVQLINQGVFDQSKEGMDLELTKSTSNYERDFWDLLYSVPDQHSHWSCEAIACYLKQYLDMSIAAGQPNLFDSNSSILPFSQLDNSVLSKSARNAPEAFIEHLLPFMLRLLDLTAIRNNHLPWLDPVWYERQYGGGYDIHETLLEEMAMALSSLAVNHPEDFAILAQKQLRHSNYETIQFLLIRAYTANGERFADEAIDYLCEQPVRLKTGGWVCSNSIIHNEPYLDTQLLLQATTPYCSEEKLAKLESVILNYYPDFERGYQGLQIRGSSQLYLLSAVDSTRLSEVANRRLQEWRRKFNGLIELPDQIEPPTAMEASFVGSPIHREAAMHMTDEQWLNAISRYNSNEPNSWFRRQGELVGGAGELASVLTSAVKKEPARFAELIWQFPENANLSYFDAVIRGIYEVELDVETAFKVCQRCHQLPGQPCGHSITLMFQRLANLPWNKNALDIVIEYALENKDKEHLSVQIVCRDNLLDAGRNSTRGSAVSAIAQLIFADKSRAAYFKQPLQKIVQDSSMAIRACAVEALTAMLNYDRDLAVSLFQQLCDTEDELLGTTTIGHFLYYALPTHFGDLAAILERMILSELPEVVRIGSRQACVASLNIEEARWLAELCLSGTEAHRMAAAEIFVANFRHAHFREFCENALSQLFNDSSNNVQLQAARCFLQLQGKELGDYVGLIESFVDSTAFDTHYKKLIHALEKTTAKLPDDVTYQICDRILDGLRSDDANIRYHSALKADGISSLLVRLYSQTKKPELQSRCLNLVDLIAKNENYELTKTLTEYER